MKYIDSNAFCNKLLLVNIGFNVISNSVLEQPRCHHIITNPAQWIMLNTTRIIYFHRLFLLLTFRSMSKEYYWFNEDTNDVQNFYFNYWENFGDHADEDPPVVVGVNYSKWITTLASCLYNSSGNNSRR